MDSPGRVLTTQIKKARNFLPQWLTVLRPICPGPRATSKQFLCDSLSQYDREEKTKNYIRTACDVAAESPMTSLFCLSLSVTGSDLLACSGRFLYSSVVIFAMIPASNSVMTLEGNGFTCEYNSRCKYKLKLKIYRLLTPKGSAEMYYNCTPTCLWRWRY